MRQENDLRNDPVGRLVLRIAVPSMLAQLVNVLYSIVDRMYIGNIPQVGELALAGVGVCGPVVTMVGAFAFLVGVGGAPLMGIAMGAGQTEKARKILANCFALLCILSLAVTLVLIPIRRPMLLLFGASAETIGYADRYFSIYLSGTLFALLSTGMSQFIICQGFARKAMQAVILGAVTNIVLDPVFIFGLDMGVAGAAVATVLSQLLSCSYVLAFLFGRQPEIPISFGGYSLRLMGRVVLMGLSPFSIAALDNVMIIALNAVLQRCGGQGRGDVLVTCATIAQSFMLLVTMPLEGITGGTQPILSYNYGAGQMDRVKQAQRCIFRLCFVFLALMTAAAWLGGHWFVGLFARDAAVAQKALWAVRVCTMALLPLGIQFEVVDGFTALGQVPYALSLSLWRKTAYFASLFLLPAFLGAEAAFYAEPISDVLGPLVAMLVYKASIDRVLVHGKERLR
ncbi:MAG: MATE family efflux transporter [Eubacteriales bacterium]|nr:MATE family efflux transporter [Eubacteriales bacterium]